MAPEEICHLLSSRFAAAIEDAVLGGGHPYAKVRADAWPGVARFLRDEPRLRLNLLRSITALDLAGTGQARLCVRPDADSNGAPVGGYHQDVRVCRAGGDAAGEAEHPDGVARLACRGLA